MPQLKNMIENKVNKNKVIKGLSSQTIVTISLGLVEIVAFSILSRLLKKEDFGYFAAISAISSVLIIFSDAGIGAALIQRKNLEKRYIDNAFTLSLILGFFISLLLLVFSGKIAHTLIDDTMTTPLRMMSITVLLHTLTSINTSLMHRRLQFLKVGFIKLVSMFSTNVIAITLAFYGLGYYSIIVKAVLDSILVFVLSSFFVKVKYRLYLDKQMSKDIFDFSGWLTASSVFRNISHQIDKLLMPQLLSVAALGAYNRPKAFINLISSKINSIFDVVMFPVLSSINDNIQSLRNAFNKSIYFVNIISLFLFLSLAVNSELLIRLFFGEDWLDLVGIFQLLSLAVMFNANGRLADCYLRSMGLTKDQFFFRVVETILNLIGVFVGSRWGIPGVALAVVFCDALMKMIKICYVASKIDIGVGSLLVSLLKSWEFMAIEIPVLFVLYVVIPHNVVGNVSLCACFFVINLLIFLFFPRIVGVMYCTEAHGKIKHMILDKVFRHV